MTRTDAYASLMSRAAQGSHQAAGALIAKGWFPGDWSTKGDRKKVVEYAVDMGY